VNVLKNEIYWITLKSIVIREMTKTMYSILQFFGFSFLILFLLATDVIQSQPSNERDIHLPEFIAHRGASWLAPENTMASIQLAWEMDVDAVEIDIFLTADDEIVVFHDRNTGRITGHNQPTEEQTLDGLRQLDLGKWKDPMWEGEQIVTLSEALATIPRGKRMFVDVKSDTRIVEPMLKAFDDSGHHPHQIVVIAFSHELAAKTKRLRPRTPVYWLEGFSQDNQTGEWSPTMETVVERAVEANLDGVNLRFAGPATAEDDVALIREAGLGYYIWTVNDLDDAQKAIEMGVDGITTDRPAWLKKQLLSRNGWRLLSKP
jgi:glycerophosphoryl diester phosphodiesterase